MFDALLTVRANLDWLVATKNAHYIAVIKKNRRIKRHCKQYVYVYRARRASRPMALLLGNLPWVEQVELDSPYDAGDAGLAGFSGGEVAGLLGFPGAGPAGAVADEESGHEDLQQERGEGEFPLIRGEKPRRCPSRRPGRAGS